MQGGGHSRSVRVEKSNRKHNDKQPLLDQQHLLTKRGVLLGRGCTFATGLSLLLPCVFFLLLTDQDIFCLSPAVAVLHRFASSECHKNNVYC